MRERLLRRSLREPQKKTRRTQTDVCFDVVMEDMFEVARPVAGGRVVDSNLFSVDVLPLRDGLYGMIRTGRIPFPIQLNSRVTTARREISLVHELMHLLDNLHKLGLGEEMVHRIAVFISTEIIPAVMKLREKEREWKTT